MATAKQLQIRVKYAKMTVNSLTKKLSAAKARISKLEAELKKAASGQKKKAAKKPAAKKKSAPKKKAAAPKKKR